MTDVQTDIPAVSEADEELDLPSLCSPEEARWWEGPREIAYEAIISGAHQTLVAEELAIAERTLRAWRRHPYWQARSTRERAARAQAYAEALVDVDQAVVDSLRAHVEQHAPVALRYALARGLLEHAPQAPVKPWLYAARRLRTHRRNGKPAEIGGNRQSTPQETPGSP